MKQLLFPLHNKAPKYKQIYEKIRALIENQTIRENVQLPSIRELANNLGVSRNTTLEAYEQLIAEGYIRSEQRKGYFANRFEPIYMRKPASTLPTRKKENLHISIDFRSGAVDQQAFPLQRWRQCANKVLNERAAFSYCESQGDLLLREQLCTYLLQSRGIHTTSDAIIVGSSTQQLLLYLSILLRISHYSILFENPGYDGARLVFQLQGFTLESIDVKSQGHCLDQLSTRQATLMYVTPSHHFPTGSTMPIQQRQQLLQWAMEKDAYLIEDDYDSEYRYEQHPIPALASMQQDHVIYISNFSKAFTPAIRLSYMILPSKLLVEYKNTMVQMEQCASFIHQRTMAHFMKLGYWDSHIRKMRAVYKKKMMVLVTSLEKHFGKRLNIIGKSAGLYVLIQLQTKDSETTLIEKALEAGVKVYPTSPFFLTPPPELATLQLGFSNCSIEEIEKGVELLATAWALQ